MCVSVWVCVCVCVCGWRGGRRRFFFVLFRALCARALSFAVLPKAHAPSTHTWHMTHSRSPFSCLLFQGFFVSVLSFFLPLSPLLLSSLSLSRPLCVAPNTPPCVDSKRLHVFGQNVHMSQSVWTCSLCTRGRFESTHRGVLGATHVFFDGFFQRAAPHTTTTQHHTPHHTTCTHTETDTERQRWREREAEMRQHHSQKSQ